MSATRKGKDAAWVDKIMESVRHAVSVDGIKYRSKTEAAAAHDISLELARYRFKSANAK